MTDPNVLQLGVTERIGPNILARLTQPCRPRLLVVADGSLNFRETDGFGLWRFLHAITVAPGVSTKPIVTLAHRGFHTPNVTVGTDTYSVATNFNFASANPVVDRANYDQIWLFGIQAGGSITDAEVQAIARFMNAGGGVFATGDHATLGRTMSGRLPRIRHMREWSAIPMGLEAPDVAVNRIDTIVDPGPNGIYEFDDQSDDIPQRIYPNYEVTAAAGGWQARLHPLLMLPGAPSVRTNSAGFTHDVDVLPDHAHESVCRAVESPATLGSTYNDVGLSFQEFRPSTTNPAQRVGAPVVAFAVSGGRAITIGPSKPPVRPQMFGVISAYDGHSAQPYPAQTQRPGRIVCDSTWHHFVNINLDGRGTTRTGLGSWSGGVPGSGSFTPSADLEKVYAYYRNTVRWLQPANRRWCRWWWDLVAVRFHPKLLEELVTVPPRPDWREQVVLGGQVRQVLAATLGADSAREAVLGALHATPSGARLADLFTSGELARMGVVEDEVLDGTLGAVVARLAAEVPDDGEGTERVLSDQWRRAQQELVPTTEALVRKGLEVQLERSRSTVKLLDETLRQLTERR
jgi:hypothetical protein